MVPGSLAVCIREVQKSLMQSSKRLIESKIEQLRGCFRLLVHPSRSTDTTGGLTDRVNLKKVRPDFQALGTGVTRRSGRAAAPCGRGRSGQTRPMN
jgi:hypothetical protein